MYEYKYCWRRRAPPPSVRGLANYGLEILKVGLGWRLKSGLDVGENYTDYRNINYGCNEKPFKAPFYPFMGLGSGGPKLAVAQPGAAC